MIRTTLQNDAGDGHFFADFGHSPARLSPGLTEGENLHEQVAASAVFFKLWTYQSAYMARFNRVQPAPLLMTHEPRLVANVAADHWVSSGLITTILIGSLVLTIAILWWYRAGDRRYQDQRRRQLLGQKPPKPDFRGL